jgi:hypothetical protein
MVSEALSWVPCRWRAGLCVYRGRSTGVASVRVHDLGLWCRDVRKGCFKIWRISEGLEACGLPRVADVSPLVFRLGLLTEISCTCHCTFFIRTLRKQGYCVYQDDEESKIRASVTHSSWKRCPGPSSRWRLGKSRRFPMSIRSHIRKLRSITPSAYRGLTYPLRHFWVNETSFKSVQRMIA